MALESRYLEETINEIQSRISLTNSAIAELRVSNMTLEGLEAEKKGSELFVPIGGGSYVKARLETADKVIVGVGAEVAVEKTIQEAKTELETRIAELKETREALEKQFHQVAERINENREQMEEFTAKLRQKEGQTGVREAKKRT